jgi:hypothetical protein
MDFLLSVLGIGGLVFAVVMLVLASRATRMQQESDERVQRLEAMAVGSVLFADDAPQPAPAPAFDMTTEAFPFVMTVPAGAGRVTGSFDRTQPRSRT